LKSFVRILTPSRNSSSMSFRLCRYWISGQNRLMKRQEESRMRSTQESARPVTGIWLMTVESKISWHTHCECNVSLKGCICNLLCSTFRHRAERSEAQATALPCPGPGLRVVYPFTPVFLFLPNFNVCDSLLREVNVNCKNIIVEYVDQ